MLLEEFLDRLRRLGLDLGLMRPLVLSELGRSQRVQISRLKITHSSKLIPERRQLRFCARQFNEHPRTCLRYSLNRVQLFATSLCCRADQFNHISL